MIGDACVFALTQIANEFSCEYGELVTRRAGADIACQSEQHQQQCSCAYQRLKKIGLDAFDYEDDLTQVPHGVWVKIQFGGLLGLQRVCRVKTITRLKILPMSYKRYILNTIRWNYFHIRMLCLICKDIVRAREESNFQKLDVLYCACNMLLMPD